MRSFTEYRLKLKGDSKMNIIKSICVAFSMYSKIPMPRVEWNEKNMKYAMCFFPLVGAVIGGLMLLVRFLCGRFGFNTSGCDDSFAGACFGRNTYGRIY